MSFGKRKGEIAKRRPNRKFFLEEKLIAQVRYYETLYLVRDAKGERVYTGSKAMAAKIMKLLTGKRARSRQ